MTVYGNDSVGKAIEEFNREIERLGFERAAEIRFARRANVSRDESAVYRDLRKGGVVW